MRVDSYRGKEAVDKARRAGARADARDNQRLILIVAPRQSKRVFASRVSRYNVLTNDSNGLGHHEPMALRLQKLMVATIKIRRYLATAFLV